MISTGRLHSCSHLATEIIENLAKLTIATECGVGPVNSLHRLTCWTIILTATLKGKSKNFDTLLPPFFLPLICCLSRRAVLQNLILLL